MKTAMLPGRGSIAVYQESAENLLQIIERLSSQLAG